MESLKEVMLRRDGLTSEEVDDLIEEARELIYSGEDPDDVILFYLLLDWNPIT